jgi:NAD(P)-dependent dehydrogenase (short-subunit alcohol dehydrogenase family)
VEACIKFAHLRAERLIIGVPDIEEGRATKLRIEQEGVREAEFCMIYELDVTSFPSIERFVNQVQNTTERVHAVVLYTDLQQQIESEDGEVIRSSHGTEMQLQVNVLSTAYLAILFLPLLLETSLAEDSPTQLEFVGCERYLGSTNFSSLRSGWEKSTLQFLNKYAGLTGDEHQYAATKFFQMGIMYVYCLVYRGFTISSYSSICFTLKSHPSS